MQPCIVEFQVGDIVHPLPVEVFRELFAKNRLEGEVVAVTDDGLNPKSLLVVRVSGMREPAIVPVEKTSRPEKYSGMLGDSVEFVLAEPKPT